MYFSRLLKGDLPTHCVSRHTVRVRFGETDLMGIVHHGTYISYFEVGRVEYMRRRGSSQRTPHFPQVNAPCQRDGIDCFHPHSGQVSKTISVKQDMQAYFTASSPTGLGIMQSGQVR